MKGFLIVEVRLYLFLATLPCSIFSLQTTNSRNNFVLFPVKLLAFSRGSISGRSCAWV